MRTLLTPTVESELELDIRTRDSLLYNILLCSPLCVCVCVCVRCCFVGASTFLSTFSDFIIAIHCSCLLNPKWMHSSGAAVAPFQESGQGNGLVHG